MKKIFSIFIILIILCFSVIPVIPVYALDESRYSYKEFEKYYLFENYGSNAEEFLVSLIEAETFEINFTGNILKTFDSTNESYSQREAVYYMIFDSTEYPDEDNGVLYQKIILYSSSMPLIYYADDSMITYNRNPEAWQRYFVYTYYIDDLGLHLMKDVHTSYIGWHYYYFMNLDNLYFCSFDLKDSSGTVYFPKNDYNDKYEESFNSGSGSGSGSDVTLGGISSIIDKAFSSLTETITSFFDTLLAPLEFIKEHLLKLNPVSSLLGVMEYITEFFAFAGDGMLIFAEFYSSMPFLVQCFFWSPFIILIVVGTVIKMLG